MKKNTAIFLIVVISAAILACVVFALYRHFVFDSIKDKGGMENPFYAESEITDGSQPPTA